MLILSRKRDEVICIGDDIRIVVVAIRGDKVRLGITAPPDVVVDREEIAKKRSQERGEATEHEGRYTCDPDNV
jgi:carbon storage regulator